MENIQESPRSQASIWVQVARPFSFTASVIPVLIGMMLAIHAETLPIQWSLLPIVLLGGILLQLGTNLVSEYYDLKNNVDRPETYGSSRALVDGIIEPKKVLIAGLLSFALAFALGMVLVNTRGVPILILGIIGILGGIFYTGKPIGYKYLALGDLMVFMLMGPLMVIGSYFSLTGDYNMNIFLASIPIGFLVVAIMHANNMRDIKHDSVANVKTLAMVLGIKGAKIEYYFLVLGAYLTTIILAVLGVMEYWMLVVLLSLPPALQNIKAISQAEVDKPELIMMMDVKTAQHHTQFGLLFIIGLLLSRIF